MIVNEGTFLYRVPEGAVVPAGTPYQIRSMDDEPITLRVGNSFMQRRHDSKRWVNSKDDLLFEMPELDDSNHEFVRLIKEAQTNDDAKRVLDLILKRGKD